MSEPTTPEWAKHAALEIRRLNTGNGGINQLGQTAISAIIAKHATGKVLLTKEQILSVVEKAWREGLATAHCTDNYFPDEWWPKSKAYRELHSVESYPTGKVLVSKEQWDEAQRDKARLDWCDSEAAGIETGSGAMICLLHKSVRKAIDSAMSADTKGTSA